jgi:NCS2 family nucleobase:cation symporter-2
MKGVRNGVAIFLSTGYCIGTVVAILLNLILPADAAIKFYDDKMLEASRHRDKSGTTYVSDNKELPPSEEEVPTSQKISDNDEEEDFI